MILPVQMDCMDLAVRMCAFVLMARNVTDLMAVVSVQRDILEDIVHKSVLASCLVVTAVRPVTAFRITLYLVITLMDPAIVSLVSKV